MVDIFTAGCKVQKIIKQGRQVAAHNTKGGNNMKAYRINYKGYQDGRITDLEFDAYAENKQDAIAALEEQTAFTGDLVTEIINIIEF